MSSARWAVPAVGQSLHRASSPADRGPAAHARDVLPWLHERRARAQPGERAPKVAVVGAGISGLGAAHALATSARVTVFEAEPRLGGHANTVDVTLDGITHGVDTGFLVFNERTYPLLIDLFAHLGVATAKSDMSFSVQNRATGLEWSGSSLNTVFAQRRNLVSPNFWRMLADLLRFNKRCTELAERGDDAALAEPTDAFLRRERFGDAFRDGYLLPMVACIWSCPTEQMLRFPIGTLIRFCHNHGLLQVADRPQWYTVAGGSRHYVERLRAGLSDVRSASPVRGVLRQPDGVWVRTDAGRERFDALVLATHSDQALALLDTPTDAEGRLLGALRYQPNRAVLHTDARVLPRRRRAWAAWNYEAQAAQPQADQRPVCLHYLINHLQPLPWQRPVVVSMNPLREPAPEHVLQEFRYAHPVFDEAAVRAQARLPSLQGEGGVWFAGAWTRYGFHEDGLLSGLTAARALLATLEAQRA